MGFANAAGGFAKGFGDAFAQSFGQSRQLQAQKEELAARKEEKRLDREYDAYESTIKGHMETAAEMKKQEAKERAYITKGQALADAYQAPADLVVSMIRDSDGDTSAVETYLKRGTFTRSGALAASTPSPVAEQNATRPASGLGLDAPKPGLDDEYMRLQTMPTDPEENTPVDTQTIDSGLGEAPVEAPAPQGNPVGESGWTYTPKGDPVDYEAEREAARVDYQRAQASGNPQAIAAAEDKLKTFDSTDRFGDREPTLSKESLVIRSLGTGPEALEAKKALLKLERLDMRKAQAGEGNWVFDRTQGKLVEVNEDIDDQGNRIAVTREGQPLDNYFKPDKYFFEKRDEILKLKTEKPVVEYDERLANTVAATKSLNDMAKIIKLDDKVLTTAAQGVTFANRLSTEAEAIMSILQGQSKGNINPDQIDSFERELDVLTPETKSTAELAAIFQAKKKLASYRMARGESGGSGSNLSNADVARFDDVLTPTADPQTNIRNLRELGRQKLDELEPIANNLNRDARVQTFVADYGEEANPLRSVGGKIAPSWDEYAASLKDPKLDEALSFINTQDEAPTPRAEEAPMQGVPEAGTVEEGYRFRGGDPGDPNNWEKVN